MTLEERVQRLERSSFRWRAAFIIMTAMFGLFMLSGMRFADEIPNEIRARSFVAVDQFGVENVRIRSSTLASGPAIYVTHGKDVDLPQASIGADAIRISHNDDAVTLKHNQLSFGKGMFDSPVIISPDLLRITKPMPDDLIPRAIQDSIRDGTEPMAPWVDKYVEWANTAPAVLIDADSGLPGGRVQVRNSKGNMIVRLQVDEQGRGVVAVLDDDNRGKLLKPSE